jgi:hypothetical protein
MQPFARSMMNRQEWPLMKDGLRRGFLAFAAMSALLAFVLATVRLPAHEDGPLAQGKPSLDALDFHGRATQADVHPQVFRGSGRHVRLDRAGGAVPVIVAAKLTFEPPRCKTPVVAWYRAWQSSYLERRTDCPRAPPGLHT